MAHPNGESSAERDVESSGDACRNPRREGGAQSPRTVGGVVGLGDRPDDDYALGARCDDLVDVRQVDAADGEPRARRAGARGVADEFCSDGGAAGLGGGRPDRSDAEVVEVVRDGGDVDLLGGVSGLADHGLQPDDRAGEAFGKILLTEVEHGGSRDPGDVGAVVDGPERAVAGSRFGEDAEQFELLSTFQGLVPQLDDVDAAGVRGIHEVGEVALTGASVGAEVEACGGDGHRLSVAADPRGAGRSAADVIVVGGGIIGLSIAWRAAQTGRSVLLIDPAPAQGATFAAAGMLAPVSEYHYQEDALLPAMLASAARYPGFVRELEPGEGAAGYLRNETLLVGIDHGDRQALADLHAAHCRAELAVEPLTTREARMREPLLGPRVTSAYRVPGDHQVDPRMLAVRLLEELMIAPRRRGRQVGIVRERAVALLHETPADHDSAVVGVRLADGTTVSGAEVVLANGVAAMAVDGLPELLDLPLRPVYGDILRLRVPDRLRPLLETTVRALVHGESVYLVPRADGMLVVGATQREDGMDAVSAGGVHRLLRDAQQVMPAVAELPLVEATARARPATADNAPLLGRVRDRDGATVRGLVVATGFFRHGVLLAPLAADIALELIEGRSDQRWSAFRPDRFTPTYAAPAAERAPA